MSTAQVLAAKPATCKHALVAIFTDEHRLASCCLKFLPALVLNMCNQDFVPHLHDYAETKSFIFVVCNIYTKQLFCVFSLPAGAVAKYCDDHVYICMIMQKPSHLFFLSVTYILNNCFVFLVCLRERWQSIVMITSMSVCMSVCWSVHLNISGTTGAIFICGSMADIQSATAEIRRGKKRKKKEETTGQKCNGLPYSIGRP